MIGKPVLAFLQICRGSFFEVLSDDIPAGDQMYHTLRDTFLFYASAQGNLIAKFLVKNGNFGQKINCWSKVAILDKQKNIWSKISCLLDRILHSVDDPCDHPGDQNLFQNLLQKSIQHKLSVNEHEQTHFFERQLLTKINYGNYEIIARSCYTYNTYSIFL